MIDRLLDPVDLRRALGTFATGVTVVTTMDADDRPRGFTANSFTSVSLDPPLILVCLAKTAASCPVFHAAKSYAVNILSEDQKAVSTAFSSRAADRFAAVDWSTRATGCPIIAGVVAWLDCRMHEVVDAGLDVTVVPARTSAEEALALEPDGIFLSNGPGDPDAVDYAIDAVRALVRERPVFGICLGHQILGLALGGRRVKLRFGHHGANQPALETASGRVMIASENHGFALTEDSIASDPKLEITHLNLNDRTVEGLRHRELPIFSVQYHPEASPGPHDTAYLFERFRRAIEGHRA